MVIRYDRLTAAAIVLAAVGAAGCSERDAPPVAEVQAAAPSMPRPVPTTFTSEEPLPEEVPAPVIDTGPVSFADGEAAYHARNYTEAARVFARYVEQRPANAWGHFMLGLSAWKSGDLDRAEDAFEEALRLDATHVKSLVNLGRVLIEQDRPGEALEKLARATDLDPQSGDVHRLLGRTYGAQGHTADAMNAYRRAIAIDPRDSWAMNNLGLLLLESGRAEDALPLLARAVELRKDVPAFQNNLGMALEHSGHFAAAADAYGGALAADPGYVKAQRNLARAAQVKDAPPAPFDLEAAAKRAGEVVASWHDEASVYSALDGPEELPVRTADDDTGRR